MPPGRHGGRAGGLLGFPYGCPPHWPWSATIPPCPVAPVRFPALEPHERTAPEPGGSGAVGMGFGAGPLTA